MAQNTKLKYMDDSYLLEDTAMVLEIRKTEDDRENIILDQTIFYPQGGGQPYDKGTITANSTVFNVEEVRFDNGLVYHIGKFVNGEIKPSENVHLKVDEPIRTFNRRNHTAGHLIDVAIKNIGENLIPSKGFHFPQGSYVEYLGAIDETKREEIMKKLQEEVNNLIKQDLPVTSKYMEKNQLGEVCDFVPDYLPEGKPIRVVFIGSYSGCPCGGTHVKSTAELKEILIEKVKNKSGNARVSYKIS